MDILIISGVALLASGLTLFSGFGLGTILLPAFILFFPVEVAVGLTAIVHLLNNLFKLVVLGKYADKRIVLTFGIPAIIAAFAGASLLFVLSDAKPLVSYQLFGSLYSIMPVNLSMGILIGGFAIAEILPWIERLEIDRRYLPVGGLMSGFFGGLSGHQGALRSAFLVHAGLSKEAFIGTGVAVACLVDIARLTLYANKMDFTIVSENFTILVAATLAAFFGVFVGSRLIKKVTMRGIQLIVAALLFIVALGLGSGFLS